MYAKIALQSYLEKPYTRTNSGYSPRNLRRSIMDGWQLVARLLMARLSGWRS
jgi:hypothetical protein